MEKRVKKLPDPEVFDKILTRDTSSFVPLVTDTAEEAEIKRKGLEMFELMFDLYVEKMLASCAGSINWGPNVKYTEEVSKSLMPNSETKLRITASTEAFTVLIYKNCWKKWNAMYESYSKFLTSKNPGKWVCLRYNKKTKANPEYETPYTDSAAGQKKTGGYTNEGIEEYRRLKKIVMTNRKENGDQISYVEHACLQRLRAKNNMDAKEKKSQAQKDGREPTQWDDDWEIEEW